MNCQPRTCRLCFMHFHAEQLHDLYCANCKAYQAASGTGISAVVEHPPMEQLFEAIRVAQQARPAVSVCTILMESIENAYAQDNMDEPDIYELGRIGTQRLAEMVAQYVGQSPWTTRDC